jgi:hypothetical protein
MSSARPESTREDRPKSSRRGHDTPGRQPGNSFASAQLRSFEGDAANLLGRLDRGLLKVAAG